MEYKRSNITIFGRATILKTLGLSQLVYSASNLVVPQGIADMIKTKSFRFIWRNKKDKIKRSDLYQDLDTGGILMTDVNIMFKALKLAWIPSPYDIRQEKLGHHSKPLF